MRPVHIGAWKSGVRDQLALMRDVGFFDSDAEDLDVGDARLPEVGYARGHISTV